MAVSSRVLPAGRAGLAGAAVAALLAGGLRLTADQHWLQGVGIAEAARVVDLLADPRWLVGLGATAAGLTALLIDWLRLRAWAALAYRTDLAGVDAPDAWPVRLLNEAWAARRKDKRNTDTDVQALFKDKRDDYTQRLNGRWLKYYLLAFALPLFGFLVFQFNLRTKTSVFPYSELAMPLLVSAMEMAPILAGALLLRVQGTAALREWLSRANQQAGRLLKEADAVPPGVVSRPLRPDDEVKGHAEPEKAPSSDRIPAPPPENDGRQKLPVKPVEIGGGEAKAETAPATGRGRKSPLDKLRERNPQG